MQPDILTPEKIAELDKITGLKTPLAPPITSQIPGGGMNPRPVRSSIADAIAQGKATAQKTETGGDTAVMAAEPMGKTGSGFADALKTIPNAAGDLFNLVKEGTYGTAKRVLYDIPKEAAGLVQDISGTGDQKPLDPMAIYHMIGKIPEDVVKSVWGLVPQSAKELANTDALAKLPGDIQTAVKENGGYVNAFLDLIKHIPETDLTPAFKQYAEQLDKARQSVVNHPVNELLGWMGLKELGANPAGTLSDVKSGLETTAETIRHPLNAAADIADELKTVAKTTKEKLGAALPDKAKLRGMTTNLGEDIFNRVKDPAYAQKVQDALTAIGEDDKNPYLDLAQKAGDKATAVIRSAKDDFSTAAKNYAADTAFAPFDVGASTNEILDSVDAFKTGKDLTVKTLKNEKGAKTGYEIVAGRYSPYNAHEIGALNNLVSDIYSATKMTPDQLMALDQKFATYYDAEPMGNNGSPTPYHAAVMELKEATQNRIRELLPPDLAQAYENYTKISDMKSDFSNRIIDAKGNLKDGAEQYIANLVNRNKGALQGKIKGYSDLLGIDLVNESQAISDAKKFMLDQAPTAGRLADFLKKEVFASTGAAIGAGAGGAVGGPGGAMVGAAAGRAAGSEVGLKMTSPKNVGAKALKETLGGAKK